MKKINRREFLKQSSYWATLLGVAAKDVIRLPQLQENEQVESQEKTSVTEEIWHPYHVVPNPYFSQFRHIGSFEFVYYQCSICKRSDIRLYRPYGEFLRNERVKCKSHIPISEQGWYVPLIEDYDGTVWSTTAVPMDALKKWESLPES